MSDLLKAPRVAEPGEPIWGKPSCCVVIWDGKRGGVTWPCGEDVNRQISELGTSSVDDLFDKDPPLGISVWEGHMAGGQVRHTMDGTDYEDVYLVGKFRLMTSDEMVDFHAGRCPWNPDDWYVPEPA